jgi:Zn-dependent peptidase ImmA (M78 family)
MDAGWTGPPFDPLELARHLQIEVLPRNDVRDARTVPVDGKARIEFNPSRPRGRMRYSVAHEIAHTFFADCTERIRNRASYHELIGDDWQLEALCNIAAAELVMPFAKLPEFLEPLTIDAIAETRAKFDVSAESILMRVVKMTTGPYAAFCASRVETGANAGKYRLDYVIPSPAFRRTERGVLLPESTVLRECTAIGYTAKGDELWWNDEMVHVEAIAIPPYPGLSSPRVVGIIRTSEAAQLSLITYLKGDASEPRGTGPRMVVHVVNDATANWGGTGFANAILRRWPEAQTAFREWTTKEGHRLGATHFFRVDSDLTIASMIAQAGYGPSARPRIRYGALESCFEHVSAAAIEQGASLHMPRIGCGQAGGRWEIVETLLSEVFSSRGIQITIYDVPDQHARRQDEQTALRL